MESLIRGRRSDLSGRIGFGLGGAWNWVYVHTYTGSSFNQGSFSLTRSTTRTQERMVMRVLGEASQPVESFGASSRRRG